MSNASVAFSALLKLGDMNARNMLDTPLGQKELRAVRSSVVMQTGRDMCLKILEAHVRWWSILLSATSVP